MKAKILLCSMLILGSLSYAAEADSVAQEVMSEVKNIEAEYQALMQKEMERKEEFKQEKETLEKEVQELKERQLGREELYAKLKEDSKVRWHRDEYKKLLKRFDEYYNKLEQKIADKEQQITELTKIEIKGLKIIFEHEIYSGGDLAITGTATVLAYNYEEQKVKKVPTTFKEIVEKYII
ncbi:adhesion protein FadA [Fusobacterium hwasookii]|uniref:adhesion protein FadA n=1 Tax=Fusobacterium hwasookii TaxID=1583098 RepID=UPI00071AEC09|nr:adhesion protein FadA [Fusobacterium hwasookii]ALQ38817.1 adhesion protein FadA [Fusobacterium hwasookii ChDC F300]